MIGRWSGLPLAGLFWLAFGWTVALALGKLWVREMFMRDQKDPGQAYILAGPPEFTDLTVTDEWTG